MNQKFISSVSFFSSKVPVLYMLFIVEWGGTLSQSVAEEVVRVRGGRGGG